MSITLMSAAWQTQLPTSRKIVLLALCDNSNDLGECYPSIPMIAAKCSLKERVVYDCLRDLEAGGFLHRESRPGRSTLYQIADPRSWRTPASDAGHPCTTCTPASDAPLHDMQDTPAPHAGTPASDAPITITKPSKNRKRFTPPYSPPLPQNWAKGMHDLPTKNRILGHRVTARRCRIGCRRNPGALCSTIAERSRRR